MWVFLPVAVLLRFHTVVLPRKREVFRSLWSLQVCTLCGVDFCTACLLATSLQLCLLERFLRVLASVVVSVLKGMLGQVPLPLALLEFMYAEFSMAPPIGSEINKYIYIYTYIYIITYAYIYI